MEASWDQVRLMNIFSPIHLVGDGAALGPVRKEAGVGGTDIFADRVASECKTPLCCRAA